MRHAIHTLQNASILYDKNITKDKLEAITMVYSTLMRPWWIDIPSIKFGFLMGKFTKQTFRSSSTTCSRNLMLWIFCFYCDFFSLWSCHSKRRYFPLLCYKCVELNDLQKSSICLILAEGDKNIIDGSDSEIQLLNICSQIMKCL